MAMVAMKTISSAHYDKFMTDGSIVLRRVVNSMNDSDDDMISAAAGIACRLCSSPACQYAINENNPTIHIAIPKTETGASTLEQLCFADLGVGDAFVTTRPDALPSTSNDVEVATLQACNQESPNAIFVDPLYGTRGETPTTVIQWSKGTIF